jgi:hypothetical protein
MAVQSGISVASGMTLQKKIAHSVMAVTARVV